MQMLNTIEPLIIFRRRRAISSLIKQLEKIPKQDSSAWIFKKERKLNRAVEDLLELTT
jgi:hypothetical protein